MQKREKARVHNGEREERGGRERRRREREREERERKRIQAKELHWKRGKKIETNATSECTRKKYCRNNRFSF